MRNRILFVASLNPFANGGGAQATHAYLDAVLDVFGRHNITLMISDTASIPDDYQDLEIIKIPNRNLIFQIIGYLRGYLSRFTEPLVDYLSKNKEKYKLCIINGSLVGGKAIPVLNGLDIKTAVIYHNYEVEYHRDNHTIESLKGHYVGMIKRLEGISFREAKQNLFLTSQDELLFRKAYGTESGHSYVLGTFDYKEREVEILTQSEIEYDLSVSGSLSNYQTTIGVMDFHDKYLPVAKRIIPGIKILLTGRNPSDTIKEMQKNEKDTFAIIPNPQEILPIVRKGRVYLCPTCIGGGLKLRAMDGLKSGMPVLVHEVSARGYDYYFDKPYFRIYHDEESFEKGLTDILSYLNTTKDHAKEINRDYYEYFGYRKGIERMRQALSYLS